MLKKHSRLIKIATLLLTIAPIVLLSPCISLIGEPQIPEKLKNCD